MNHTGWKFVLALLTLCASFTAAGKELGFSFSQGDWEIVCDNTRTCRMAGYSPENAGDGERGSVLITRAAGPNTPLEGKVTLAGYDAEEYSLSREEYILPRVLTLWIDGKSKGELFVWERDVVYSLTPAQIRALLVATRNDKEVKFEGASKPFTLSGKGVSAVLLKMDEFQGRVGTPGALIRKGEKPEEDVLPPLPVPVIQVAKVSNAPLRALTAPEVTAIKPLLLQSLNKGGECYSNMREFTEADKFTLTPLDEQHVLISTLCWHTRRSHSYAYWVADSALKGMPKLVTEEANSYEEGVLHSGSGTCGHGSLWVWDGQEFRQGEKWHTGMCRGIHLDGIWPWPWRLPTFVTKIVKEDGSPYGPTD